MTQTSAGYSGYTASLLFQWLGSFWNQICEDSDLVRDMQMGQGVLAARLYQEFAECIDLSDRKNIPIYHNNLTTSMVFKLSERNTGANMSIRMDMDIPLAIGPQTGDPYIVGKVATIGGITPFEGITAYPIDPAIKDINILVDSITNPTIILVKDINFKVDNGTIYFINNSDPYATASVPKTNVYDLTSIVDQTFTLFAYNSLIDREYIYNYAGFIFDLKSESSEQYKKATNYLWDAYNYGPVKQRLQASIAGLLGEPSIINDTETVVAIITNDYMKQIATDANVYIVSLNSTIRSTVVKGAVLSKGDLLTETIKIYENLDFSRLTADNEYCQQFINDMPALLLPPCFFRARLNGGLGVTFEWVNIINDGIDKNGNTKFKFDMYGSSTDVAALWSDVSSYCETNNIGMDTIFDGVLDSSYSNRIGAVCGRLQPLKFFLNNLFKTNMFIAVIDMSALTDFGRSHFNDLSKVHVILPASTYMIIAATAEVNDADYDLALSAAEGYTSSVSKSTSESGSYKQTKSRRSLTYYDAPIRLKWVPVCRSEITPVAVNSQGFECKENT